MTEQALKDFFENTIDTSALASDLNESQTSTGRNSKHIAVTQIEEEGDFQISTDHLVKLCDAVLDGHLKLVDLNTIAYSLMFSDYFDWDGNLENGCRISEVIFAWDNPEIDYDLTVDNVEKWRHYLITGENQFDPNELKRKKNTTKPKAN